MCTYKKLILDVSWFGVPYEIFATCNSHLSAKLFVSWSSWENRRPKLAHMLAFASQLSRMYRVTSGVGMMFSSSVLSKSNSCFWKNKSPSLIQNTYSIAHNLGQVCIELYRISFIIVLFNVLVSLLFFCTLKRKVFKVRACKIWLNQWMGEKDFTIFGASKWSSIGQPKILSCEVIFKNTKLL